MNTILQSIVPAQTLGIQIKDWTDGRVELMAPLAPNRNDKGTAFAGSIVSMLSLAGWAAITLALREAGIDADVMVVKSEIEYLKPATDKLCAEATLAEDEREQLLQEIRERDRGRICIQARLYSNGTDCARMTAYYAVIS